jgi:hypothetical protein
MSNKMKLEVERVSNGWIAKSDIAKHITLMYN